MGTALRPLNRLIYALVAAFSLLIGACCSGQEVFSPNSVLPNGQPANAPIGPESATKNWSSYGLGCCVVASNCANSKHLKRPEWASTLERLSKLEPGGHYPEKLQRVLEKAKLEHPDLKWEQWWGQGSDGVKKVLDWNARGFPIGITWGTGERYGMRPIAHMVSLTHADSVYWQILDNNFPQERSTVPATEGIRRWGLGSDQWAVVLVVPEDRLPNSPLASRNQDWVIALCISMIGTSTVFAIVILKNQG